MHYDAHILFLNGCNRGLGLLLFLSPLYIDKQVVFVCDLNILQQPLRPLNIKKGDNCTTHIWLHIPSSVFQFISLRLGVWAFCS